MGLFDTLWMFGAKTLLKASSQRAKLTGALIPAWNYRKELPQNMDFAALLKAYRSWIYVCSNKNSIATASTPLNLYVAKPTGTKGMRTYHSTVPISKQKKKQLLQDPIVSTLPAVKKAEEIEEVVEHPWLDLMGNVNTFMNQFSLWELTELYQELCGNCYWYLVEDNLKVPREIWPVPPDAMKVVPDPKEFIRGYVYQRYMTPIEFDEREIIHFKMPNPRSPYYGMSPLAAATAAYNLNEHMATYDQAIFRNMGKIEGYFYSDEEISNEEFDRVKEELKILTGGAENAGKTPLLPKSIKYDEAGFGPRELSHLKGKESVKEEICNVYGQSLAMYSEKPNRANSEMAEYSFQKNTIRPRLLRIEQKINEKIMPRYDESLFVAFENNVPEDVQLAIKRNTEYVKANILPVNEVRGEIGLDELDGFDEPWVQAGTMPASMAAEGMGQPISPEDLEETAETVAKAIEKHLRKRRS